VRRSSLKERGLARKSVNVRLCINAEPCRTFRRMLSAIKPLWERTFLREVLQRDRWLGVIFAVFVLCQGIAQVFRVEITPFFLFGMYSEPIVPEPAYVRVACSVDGEPLTQAQMPRFAGELFFSTLYRYQVLHDHQFQDHYAATIADELSNLPPRLKRLLEDRLSYRPDQAGPFGAWTIRYLGQALGRSVRTVQVTRETYRYVDRRPQLVDASIILSAHAQSDVDR
jgi:hypothetical protein